jgi:protein tyrosine phosphatase (PTP) superfamily phosphohydrolase (DUF442 family)
VKGVHRRTLIVGLAVAACLTSGLLFAVWYREYWFEKRVKVLVPGRLVRGAWQRPGPLRKLIEREGIRTIVTLTAINSGDPKFLEQSSVLRSSGIRWVIVPMRGSRGTVEQMALAADLMADPDCQPVFFHCVAGHHRTSLAHAAYLIRHEGFTAEQAWEAVSNLPWARPDSAVDRNDRFLIEEFARVQESLLPDREHGVWEIFHGTSARATGQVHHQGGRNDLDDGRVLDRLESGEPQFRDHPAGASLPVESDAGLRPRDETARARGQDGAQSEGPESLGGMVPAGSRRDPGGRRDAG